MDKFETLADIGTTEQIGKIKRLNVDIVVKVGGGSFLHIGGSPTPLADKKAPIFMIGDQPAIPASSFKGAFRNKVEAYLIEHQDEIKTLFRVEDAKCLMPCIPASKPTAAEKSFLTNKAVYREKNCEVEVDEKRIKVPDSGICPVCYLFGANGLMGFLRIPNFLPITKGLSKLEQTQIGIDRKTGTFRHGAIVRGDQVLPGTKFVGKLEILLNDGNFEFGVPRKMGENNKPVLDTWLNNTETEDLNEIQIKIIDNLILRPLKELDRLGGQKSKGAGKVEITVGVPP